MTDTPSSPSEPEDDDLLASLYLDGEATSEERAMVEADAELLARVREYQGIADGLADVAPPPDLARLQISAALDLFDEQHAAPPVAAATDNVRSLGAQRERRQARGIPTWLGAAAAAALVVGGIGFATTLGGDDDEATDVAMETADASASGAERVLEGEDAATDDSDAMAESMMAEEAEDFESATTTTAADAGSDDAVAADEAMADEAMEDDAMEEESSDPADEAPLTPFEPIPLAELEATSAAEYFVLLDGVTLQPISASPCADSPTVQELTDLDSYIPVVFDGGISSLLVAQDEPSNAVIVGPTCEIELS